MQSEDEARWQRVIVEENPAFARFMGVHITSGSRDRIEAELTVGEELANRNLIIGVTHPAMTTRYGWGAVRAQA